jgi:Alpha-L-fucosidase
MGFTKSSIHRTIQTGWNPTQTRDFSAYIQNIAVPQTRENLARYKPDIVWWDTPVNMTPELAKPLADLLAENPCIISNDRLGGGYKGDTKTPEQRIPPRGYPPRHGGQVEEDPTSQARRAVGYPQARAGSKIYLTVGCRLPTV